jgi:arabinose-5-phosphate isomerase
MSRKSLGITTVVKDGKLAGMISDGDLRRLLLHQGKDAMELTAGDCMNPSPKIIAPSEFAAAAVNQMEEKKITSLAVVDDAGTLVGILHIHDLWGTEWF